MVILYQGKPLTEEKHFGESDIYGQYGFIGRIAQWLSGGVRTKEIVVNPNEDLVQKVSTAGDQVVIRRGSINLDPVCRKLHLLYR